ncbi:MAG: GDSL-type esterase/lipase family protein, partial [Elusimicrobiota bacterium]
VILCVGDSFVYGLGAPKESSFPCQLERLLNSRQPEKRFRVVNGGVPAQNSTQLLGRLRSTLKEVRPDMVIVLTGGANLWNYLGYREPGFEWLDDILSRDDMYDLLFIDNKAEESISSFSVHGSRAIKPRYVNKDVFYQTGMIEHNCLKIASDFDKYRHNLTDFDNKSLTMKNIKAFHSQRLGV